jgi:hypothetical protein
VVQRNSSASAPCPPRSSGRSTSWRCVGWRRTWPWGSPSFASPGRSPDHGIGDSPRSRPGRGSTLDLSPFIRHRRRSASRPDVRPAPLAHPPTRRARLTPLPRRPRAPGSILRGPRDPRSVPTTHRAGTPWRGVWGHPAASPFVAIPLRPDSGPSRRANAGVTSILPTDDSATSRHSGHSYAPGRSPGRSIATVGPTGRDRAHAPAALRRASTDKPDILRRPPEPPTLAPDASRAR